MTGRPLSQGATLQQAAELAATATRIDELKPGSFTALVNALREGVSSCAFHVLGDSTGATNVRWPYLLGQRLATKFPNYGVQWIPWNDVSETYDPAVQIQAPPSGERYLDCSGGSATHPGDGTALAGLDVAVKVTINAIPTVSNPVLVAKDAAGTNRQFRFVLAQNSGKLAIQWSIDGSTLITAQSTTVPAFVFGTPIWLRAQHLWDNGSAGNTATFFTSTDGVTWTQLGTPVVTAGVITGYYNAVASYSLGAYAQTSTPLTGQIYKVWLRAAINGPVIAPISPDAWALWSSGVALGGSPMLTVVNGSKPGADIVYLSDSTRLPKMTIKDYNTLALVLSESHNDFESFGPSYLANWDTWISRIRARFPYVPITAGLQNPRIAPGGQIDQHRFRQTDIVQYAAKNGLGMVNVNRAFNKDVRGLAALIQSDGVHPTDAAGSPLWADTYLKAMPV